MIEAGELSKEITRCTDPAKWKQPPDADAPDDLVRQYIDHLSECKYHSEIEALSDSFFAALVTEVYAQLDLVDQEKGNTAKDVQTDGDDKEFKKSKILSEIPEGKFIKSYESAVAEVPSPKINLEEHSEGNIKISVVGIGGGGGNAVNYMIEKRLKGVNFIAVNCDLQALENNKASNKIQVGKTLTYGLGGGGDVSLGQRVAESSRLDITKALTGSNIVFIAACMGGGTGTGSGPIVANIAKSVGALVIGIVTKPFTCEGKKRIAQAEIGIKEMKKQVDTLIVIPNQKLLSIVERSTPLQEAFNKANDVIYSATRGIAELITTPGLINIDFADIRTIMHEMGDALMGSGIATGENRAIEAAHAAISSPLLEGVSISGALSVLVNVTGGPTMSLVEVDEAVSVIHEAAGEEANVIMGAAIDENLTDEMIVTVIANGFSKRGEGTPHFATPAGGVINRFPGIRSDVPKINATVFKQKGINSGFNRPDPNSEKYPEADEETKREEPTFLRKIMD